jgi:tetratricopeptide (TPR) repeat protein
MAPPDARKALDRRLWADALQALLERQAADDPLAAITLAPRAETELPERPELAARLLNQGLEQASRDPTSLRLAEVKAIGAAYRDKLHNPDRALQLYRNWLRNQRDRLSPTDAEGPVDLAALYEELLQDRHAARELLERAWKIDPGSKAIAEAFRARGYRRVQDQWVEDSAATADGKPASKTDGEAPPTPAAGSFRGLRGLTPEEVTQQLRSVPDRKVLCGTKGQLVEQWIFRSPTQRGWRYVNFVRTPGELLPRVVSDYTLPESAVPKGLAPGP